MLWSVLGYHHTAGVKPADVSQELLFWLFGMQSKSETCQTSVVLVTRGMTAGVFRDGWMRSRSLNGVAALPPPSW